MVLEIYNYQKKRFFLEQTLTNLFTLGISFTSLFFIINKTLPALMWMAFIVSIYSVLNNFLFKVNSEKVEISESMISFEAYGKKDSYQLDKLVVIKLKEFPSSGKIFVRITDSTNKQRKYWINTSSFENGKKLFKQLLDLEYQRHPDTLKARARSQSTLSSRKEKKFRKEKACV